ncbi:MAG TPA: hypothetical protein VNR39_06765 [Pseudolabrys sp.]|nr:hypothetical protein [Pseudolabrys sp.]
MRKEIAVALITIIPACLTAVLGYLGGASSTDASKARSELAEKRLSYGQSQNPNFKELQYSNYGISLQAPRSWTVEDGPARLAGGEFSLVSRYEDTLGAIGMNFRLRPVQPNYVNNLAAQIENQLTTFKANFGTASASDVTISGLPAKVFEYEVPTGKRKMAARQYWLRVVPDVQLQILSANYTDAADRQQFWKDVEQIISSIIVATDVWALRYKKSPGT